MMTNNEIYKLANDLQRAFEDNTQYLPVKVNFYIQKNKATLLALAQDIERSRLEILKNYGTLNEETNNFEFSGENAQKVVADLNDLFALEQDVKIHKVDIDAFGDLTLTTGQMEALMFMID